MFIRNANPCVRSAALRDSIRHISAVALAIACAANTVVGQDAAALLDTLRQSIAKQLPAQVRVTASGSGYEAKGSGSPERQQYRIASYVQQLDLAAATATERIVLHEANAAAPAAAQAAPRAAASPQAQDERVLWTTPLGFLAAAGAGPVAVRSETLLGTPYQVLTVTRPGGQQLHGYVNANNVLERVRTEIDTVPVEAVFMSWQDFGGVRFPSLIIRKEGGDVSEILVVSALDRTGGGGDNAIGAGRSGG